MKHAVGDDWGRLRSRVQCVRASTSAVCARTYPSLSPRISPRPSVHPSVRLSVGRPIGRFALSFHLCEREKERERERTWEREMCGRTRVRSLSDPTVGHATEVADPIYGTEEILCRIMDSGRAHDMNILTERWIYFARKTWVASERIGQRFSAFR